MRLTDTQVYPPQSPDIFLHEYVLAGWGMPIGKSAEGSAHFSFKLRNYRRTFRSRGTGPHLPRAPAVEFLCYICAIEYAWRSFVASEYDGNFLDQRTTDTYIYIHYTTRRKSGIPF
jgi:hypothetical protein